MMSRNWNGVNGSFAISPSAPSVAPESEMICAKLTDAPSDRRDRLVARLGKGPTLSQEDFGDPVTTDDYSVCLYEDAALEISLDAPSGASWAAIGTRGYRYSESSTAGELFVRMVGGIRSVALARARGSALTLPAPASATSFFTPGSTLTVQIHGAGSCLSASFAGDEILTNTVSRVRAKK